LVLVAAVGMSTGDEGKHTATKRRAERRVNEAAKKRASGDDGVGELAATAKRSADRSPGSTERSGAHERERSQWTLHRLMSVPKVEKDTTAPSYDPEKTKLFTKVSPQRALNLIDALPRSLHGKAERLRLRTRDCVEDLLRPGMEEFSVSIYVRGAVPPKKPLIVNPPRVLLIALRGGLIYPVALLAPEGGKEVADSAAARAVEQQLLAICRWQMQHMPVLARDGAIHEGMPGRFHPCALLTRTSGMGPNIAPDFA
jgi:hypothetical protein